MIKYLLALFGLLGIGCKDDVIEPIPSTYILSIDSVLTQDGQRSLPIDLNGFYILTLDSSFQSKQTIHRVTGIVSKDGAEPYPPEVVDWESSHSWITGDSIGYVVRRVVNALGQWTVVDTQYINVPSGLVVPTINPTSISGNRGEINTMIAPIYGMKGDTMIVTAKLWTPLGTHFDTIKILLQ